ncbi:YchJ family metal-binding protein [Marinomonas sp. 15G1-11]|uniref:YchJ family metal-binding protein n=1 Tax=Marinomonas phaeophyticola TaxID=3004091 RepID=A0ABT4JXC4_9GAMM|nr:YchJ family metal-binding protein [Marinomonas sp. 15G1-11]MCZ2722938.1 YchJ family metal-binding protein [Marinomonas sp. 15G1-11]
MPTPNNCPCGTTLPYEMCCAMYHNNPGTAPTAEALMRSRYSAFAMKNFEYIQQTQKLDTSPDQSVEDISQSNDNTQWIKLEILETQDGGEKDKTGIVSFCAHFKEGKHIGRLSERSIFKKSKQVWHYISGEHEVQGNTPLIKSSEMNIGRNDPCHCGSNKKFKKCCG